MLNNLHLDDFDPYSEYNDIQGGSLVGGNLQGGRYVPSNAANRHCQFLAPGKKSGKPRCAKFAPGPYPGYPNFVGYPAPMYYPAPSKPPKALPKKPKKSAKALPAVPMQYGRGSYSGGCENCANCSECGAGSYSGGAYSGGASAKQLAAAKKNPWLKFLKRYRKDIARQGIPFDMSQARAVYYAQKA